MKKNYFLLFLLLLSFVVSGQTDAINGINLNKACYDGDVKQVWAGTNLPQGFNGEDVIIGIMDWGFDYTHPVFYDTTMTNYRVLRAWDQFKKEGPAPDGFDYGREYVGMSELLEGQCDTANIYSYGYHGTHVGGIAAGAAAGTNYRGIAHGANLIFCTFLISEQSVTDAMDWMYDVAQEEGKRLVVNMSWGLYYPDNFTGTGVIGQKMEELTQQGVVFVTSAGNNGDENFHISYDFDAQSNDTMRTQIAYSYTAPKQVGQAITMTNSEYTPFEFALEIFDTDFQSLVISPLHSSLNLPAKEEYQLVFGEDTFFYEFDVRSEDPDNHRPEVRLIVKNLTNHNWRLGLIVTAELGVFHAWNVIELETGVGNWGAPFYQPAAKPNWTAGDPNFGLGIPSTVECAITVAAHLSQFMNSGGQICGFSSYGPTIDGRMKPDVSAPGNQIISSISSFTNSFQGNVEKTVSFNGKNYIFGKASGTSMSSPFTAGVAALVLQANPYLSSEQVKEILIETARNDEYTELSGEIRFGNGKVDAYQAILMALETTGINQFEVEEMGVNVYPNPSNGELYLSLKSNEFNVTLQIFDFTGKMVYQDLLQPGVNRFSLHHLQNGCYFLKTTNSQSSQIKKWIKTE